MISKYYSNSVLHNTPVEAQNSLNKQAIFSVLDPEYCLQFSEEFIILCQIKLFEIFTIL
jgi:hypothetical protein